ncbi:MauE/DoxX family redox-associated membrane protein [Nannocystis sp.]|uniref:MauE/DoxX family redox-associated membrane protein n=1 Tax=Nannocystis sp. TaxID=1962667 RepID=UPI002428C03C|nr:MauE/DoxX family redox-associated membrane protein [Nannocystis sp.]MBK7827283.1 DoxX family protein [Nannocystis sp.]MBK9754695.1 DoxX family protein [Nannocystis sp.]
MTSAVSHVSEDMSPKPSHSRLGPTLAWLARLSLAGVFLAAAAPKLADPAAFAAAIANYQAFPDVSVNLIATLVPTLELIGALALLTPWRRGGALLLAGLLLGFTALLAVSLARGLDLSCGCFGASASETADPVSALHLLRNLGLLALAALVLAAPRPASVR